MSMKAVMCRDGELPSIVPLYNWRACTAQAEPLQRTFPRGGHYRAQSKPNLKKTKIG
jgi:hypothetical protein